MTNLGRRDCMCNATYRLRHNVTRRHASIHTILLHRQDSTRNATRVVPIPQKCQPEREGRGFQARPFPSSPPLPPGRTMLTESLFYFFHRTGHVRPPPQDIHPCSAPSPSRCLEPVSSSQVCLAGRLGIRPTGRMNELAAYVAELAGGRGGVFFLACSRIRGFATQNTGCGGSSYFT